MSPTRSSSNELQGPTFNPAFATHQFTTMKYKLWTVAGALAASAHVLAQNAAQPSTPPDDFKILDREVGVSGDFLYGNGYVQLPVGEALVTNPDVPDIGNGKFTQADRKSALYYGGTVSGSVGKTWYLDISYSRGTTDGELNDLGVYGDNNQSDKPTSLYKLTDEYYQVYGKYAFPQFSGTRFAAYLRLGATFSQNKASAVYSSPSGFSGTYDSSSNDYLGNIGLGGEYSLFRGDSFKVTTVLEGEIFAGIRKSSVEETLDIGVRFDGAASLDSLVYGGLGRGVLRFVKTFDKEGRWKFNADLGFQGKYLINDIDSLADKLGSTSDRRRNVNGTELLWGPYGRLGLSYSF